MKPQTTSLRSKGTPTALQIQKSRQAERLVSADIAEVLEQKVPFCLCYRGTCPDLSMLFVLRTLSPSRGHVQLCNPFLSFCPVKSHWFAFALLLPFTSPSLSSSLPFPPFLSPVSFFKQLSLLVFSSVLLSFSPSFPPRPLCFSLSLSQLTFLFLSSRCSCVSLHEGACRSSVDKSHSPDFKSLQGIDGEAKLKLLDSRSSRQFRFASFSKAASSVQSRHSLSTIDMSRLDLFDELPPLPPVPPLPLRVNMCAQDSVVSMNTLQLVYTQCTHSILRLEKDCEAEESNKDRDDKLEALS